jgi:hypothetical protein
MALFCELGFSAVTDTVNCNMGVEGTLTATYDSATGVVSYTASNNGSTGSGIGKGYQQMTKAQIAKDDTVLALAKTAKISISKVNSAAVFVIDGNSEGAMAIVKFLDAKQNVLGASAVLGSMLLRCQ